jgi:hypothetical protein
MIHDSKLFLINKIIATDTDIELEFPSSFFDQYSNDPSLSSKDKKTAMVVDCFTFRFQDFYQILFTS